MPTIAVNLGNVEAFESLPVGTYLAEVQKVTYREPRVEGKFPQLMVSYLVIDGDHIDRSQNEFVSLSPKAAFRLKRFFMKFGLGDTPNLEVDDDTNELLEPNIVAAQVIFKVSQDRQDATRFNTELVSVESLAPEAAAPPARRPAAAAVPVKVTKPAAAEPEEETEEEAEEAPAPVAPRRPVAAPAQAGPQRRTLR